MAAPTCLLDVTGLGCPPLAAGAPPPSDGRHLLARRHRSRFPRSPQGYSREHAGTATEEDPPTAALAPPTKLTPEVPPSSSPTFLRC